MSRYPDNYEREVYDPDRVASEAYDDRDEQGVNIYDDAGWNDPSDCHAHL